MKRIIGCWTLLLLLAQQGLSQADTFYGIPVKQSARSNELHTIFKEIHVFELQTHLLDQFVRKEDYDGRVNLVFGAERNWQMLLTEHDLRSPNFLVRSDMADNNKSLSAKRNITFRGHLIGLPESKIRLSIDGDFLYGFIDDGQKMSFIEPLDKFVPGPSNHYVVYQKDEIRDGEHAHECGMILMEEANRSQITNQTNRSVAPLCLTTELAIAMDTSYINHMGRKIAAINQVISVMNTVDPNFDGSFDSNIDFQIIECYTPDENPAQWTATVDGNVLLNNFRSWGNSGGFVNDFDLGQLWTKRNFHYKNNYGVVGLAYINTTCNYSRFHLLEHYSSGVNQLRVLTAHEIGHNFGARHDTATTSHIMKPSINASATTFSTESQDYVNSSLPWRSCLSACGTPCDYLIEVSTSGDYEAMGIIHTDGAVTIGTNSLFSAPQVILNPNFTANSGVVFEINNDGCSGN